MIVLIKLVGFSRDERHAFETMARLSSQASLRLRLWQDGNARSPNLLIVDTDGLQAEFELQSPRFNPHTRVITVGTEPPSQTTVWKHFMRPLDWKALVQEMAYLFSAQHGDFGPTQPGQLAESAVPPGLRTCLLVGLDRLAQLYLRARLAIQGITHVEEAADAAQAVQLLTMHVYDVVFCNVALQGADFGAFVSAVRERSHPPRAFIALAPSGQWGASDKWLATGCNAVAEIPFDPPRITQLIAGL
ncbi:MAG: hypothetical protein ACT4NV_13715 [Rhodoferax sp.]